jgi:hypothetical protein
MPSFRIQYPKLLLLCASFVLAYALYSQGVFDILPQYFGGMGYVSMFVAGMLFCIGFTAPFGLFLIIELAPGLNPFWAALIGGMGGVLVDLVIFEVARLSLQDELRRLASSGLIRRAVRLLYHERVSDKMRFYTLWALAGFIIASPLPDEIGLTLLSGVATVHPRKLALFCFALDTLGILAVLLFTDLAVR